MELIDLTANTRTKTGNGPARALRREGKMPAVLYGPGREPVSLTVVVKELETALKSSAAAQPLFNLTVAGDDSAAKTVMIKELQTNPLSLAYLHVDFYEVAMDRKITVNVPIVTTGNAIGVEMGGMLQIIRRELEVSCMPLEIPESIIIDVSDLDIGDSIHVEDITLEGDVEIPADVNFTVLTVLTPKKEEEEVEEEEGEEGLEEGEEGAEASETEDEA